MVRWASGYNLFYSGGKWATPWYGKAGLDVTDRSDRVRDSR
jgi:hypothetical protein